MPLRVKMIRIITYNIHFGKRLPHIISWIHKQTHVDVICLQEVPISYRASLYRSLPRAVWGRRFTKSFILRKKTYGIVTLFRKKNLQLTKANILHMGSHPMERSLLRNPMQKSCLITTFRMGMRTVSIANTHLVFLAANRARYKQISMIADRLANHGHSLIITGDFNILSVRSNKKLLSYMKTFGFRTIEKRLQTYRLALLKYQLDYVFVKRCSLAALTAERVHFSDHYPITAAIRLAQ